MSNEALTWAWGQVKEKKVPRSLIPELIAMADQANDQGVAWLLNSTLAAKTATTPRTVQRSVNRLSELGVVEIIERRNPGNRNRSNLYLIPIPGVDETTKDQFIAEMSHGTEARRRVPRKAKEDQNEGGRATPVSPTGRHECHPLGDTSVTHNPQYEPTLKGYFSLSARETENEAQDSEPQKTLSKPKPRSQGPAFIPEDWTVPDHLRQRLTGEGYEPDQIDEQAVLFTEYWHERRDAKAKKASWNKTFLTWMKRAGKKRTPEGVQGRSHNQTGEQYVTQHRKRATGASRISALASREHEDHTEPPGGHTIEND